MPLDPSDLVTLSRLLDEALDLEAAAAEAWLAKLPAEHRTLVPRLREMLAAHSARSEPGFMADGPKLSPVDDTVARPGERIGPYLLIREIGRGGMGAVWLAERADGMLKRQIALKLPRLAWGTGLAERMARERDIGALLEHPHIARLYDAGVDDRGRPYLALEYIAGEPLDAWCKARALSIRDRLRLFLQVANAVAYAHGRLVVHRDLKPSNVLISPDGQAHLLDFGIATLLDEAEVDRHLTQEQGRVLTPSYASPEQIRGETITVASDVYSLGVLLYELLTGRLPHAVGRQGLAGLEQAILEGEPAAASTRADRADARALRGDLDAILAKALRREPHRRYASVDALSTDVERHLAGETVLAQPDSLAYRLRKTLRRHRVVFAATAAVLLAVVGGAGASLVQAHRANDEAERARLVKEFVVDIFTAQGGPDGALAQMPAQALLERSAGSIDHKFSGQPILQAELYGVVSQMFLSMAKEEQAVSYATRQVELLNTANADRWLIARATLSLAETLNQIFRNSEAPVRLRKVLELAGDDNGLQARAHAALALALMYSAGDTDGAGRQLDLAESALKRGKVSELDRATVLFARADWLGDSAYKSQSEVQPVFDQAIALAIAAEGPNSRLATTARMEAAKIMIRSMHTAAGRSYLNAALATMRAVGGPNDVNAALWEARATGWMFTRHAIPFEQAMSTLQADLAVLHAQNWAVPQTMLAQVELRLGHAYITWGDIERGYPLVVRAEYATNPEPLAQWWHRSNLVEAAQFSDHADEAPALAREMVEIGKGLHQGDQYSYYPLVHALVHAQRYAEAEAALAEYDALPGSAERKAADEKAQVTPDEARLLVALERGHAAELVQMTDHLKPAEGVHTDEAAWLARAAALCAVGRFDESAELFAQWLPRLATDRYDASPQLAYWRARKGLCELGQGKKKGAREMATLASAAIARQPGVSAHLKAPVLELAERLKRS